MQLLARELRVASPTASEHRSKERRSRPVGPRVSARVRWASGLGMRWAPCRIAARECFHELPQTRRRDPCGGRARDRPREGRPQGGLRPVRAREGEVRAPAHAAARAQHRALREDPEAHGGRRGLRAHGAGPHRLRAVTTPTPTTELERIPGSDAVKVLLATRDPIEAEELARALREAHHDVTVVQEPPRAAELARSIAGLEVLVADGSFAQGGPADVVDAARRSKRDVEIILLSDEDNVASAVSAMSRGALAYLPRPVSSPERGRLEREVVALRRELDERYGFEGIVGTSASMRRVIEQLRLAAPTDANVLILGESGTGKELVAR